MAKGLEDTAFYIYNRLAALNEVGGEPQRFGMRVEEFHRRNAERLEHWPSTLLATSTHDTKRSEDVRARMAVISEMPEKWRHSLGRWRTLQPALETTDRGERGARRQRGIPALSDLARNMAARAVP